ncbi:tectonic-1 [Anoplophora glabripennis]|uniref:tectonic-1 n=1 Tax=Anoplophora glabripennis TaxID=217634 RepID=UPI00087378C5|nr:tectonic-1 [Anoplophora glabripennis]
MAGKKPHRTGVTSGQELCTCNLQLNICDINCCCDEDCSPEDKSIFRYCESENFYYDTRYCDYMKYIYINNTPFQWHVNQNGLFCVLKSNLPPSYTVQRKQPLTSFKVAEQEKISRFSWPHTSEKKEVKFNMSEDFVYGNNIWMVYRDEIKKFRVPNKYFSNTCIIKEDVLNFKNVKCGCAQIDISEENRSLHFKNFFQNITVVANPNFLNISKYKNIHCIIKEDVLNFKNVKCGCAQIDISEENRSLHFKNFFQNITVVANPNFLNISKYKNIHECPKNICLVIFPKLCESDSFDKCHNVSRNDSRLDFKCSFDIRNNRNDCKNAIKALRYNFYHNGTQGYTRIEILGVVEDISYEFGEGDVEFYQEFEVNFWWVNQTRNYSAMLSGNPGYITGRPILSGNLVRIGNSTNTTVKIGRIFDDYLEHFLVLPENVEGKCILNKTKYLAIEFGYNLLTKCKLSMALFNKKQYPNGTEICKELQKTVLKMWRITGKNKTVGMFGNANANIPEDWIKIMYNVDIEELLNKTTGLFSSKNTSLTCFGLVKEVLVDIYHSRIDFKELLNQEKILGVTYSFGGFVNKTLSYDKQRNRTYLELELKSRVVFYDISVQKQKKFVDRPSLEIRLPYDFFYPFVKIDSGVEAWSASVLFHFVLCVIVLFLK